MIRLLATCCPGLEHVLAEEIVEIGGACVRAARGSARFETTDAAAAYRLGCADNLYALVGGTQAPPVRAGLPGFAERLAALPVAEALDRAGLSWRGGSLHVSASRAGSHSYSRFEAASAALAAVSRSLSMRPGTAEAHDVALRLDIDQSSAELSVKLTGPDFRFRGRRAFSPAAIRPTIARALVRLTGVRPDDVFADPFCGSGTILAERLYYPARAVIGGDISGEALDCALENLGGRAALHLWDAASLPLGAGSVSAIATNPPWGKQIELPEEDRLYAGFLREAMRVLAPEGRLVMLTDRVNEVQAACQSLDISMQPPLTVSLHGMLCGVFTFRF